MKKLVFQLLCFMALLPSLAFSVFASENEVYYVYPETDEEGFIIEEDGWTVFRGQFTVDELLTPGIYTFRICYYSHAEEGIYEETGTPIVFYDVEITDSYRIYDEIWTPDENHALIYDLNYDDGTYFCEMRLWHYDDYNEPDYRNISIEFQMSDDFHDDEPTPLEPPADGIIFSYLGDGGYYGSHFLTAGRYEIYLGHSEWFQLGFVDFALTEFSTGSETARVLLSEIELNELVSDSGLANLQVLTFNEETALEQGMEYPLLVFLSKDAGPVDIGADYHFAFVPTQDEASSPLSSVKESMSSVLEWVGTVATSLLSGELNPLLLLLAIPIAISLIFLAIKAIKMLFNL